MSEQGPPPPKRDRRPLSGESDIVFPRLDEAQIATLVAAGRRATLEKGQILSAPGDLDPELVLVLSGCVEIVDEIGTEDEAVLVSYGARQFVAELNLITMEPALLTAHVVE